MAKRKPKKAASQKPKVKSVKVKNVVVTSENPGGDPVK